MANNENGDEEETPLAELADHVATRRESSLESDSVWSDIIEEEYTADDFVWDHFSETIQSQTTTTSKEPFTEDNAAYRSIDHDRTKSDVPDGVGGLSLRGQILHGYILSIIFLTGAAIYAATSFEILPRHYWLLSLPFFALGLILIVPVVAWEAGVWDPTQIG